MSILSEQPDGVGYYYGFYKDDHRQINVRWEAGRWQSYVGGKQIAPLGFLTKEAAELNAIAYIEHNPE